MAKTTPLPTALPRVAKLAAGMASGKRTAFAQYGRALAKQGHPLAEVIAADVTGTKKQARATFQQYASTHLAPRYPRLANNMVHFTLPVFPLGMGFRYGLLEELDSFGWKSAMTTQMMDLLADDHAAWILDLVPRSVKLGDLMLISRFAALRRLNLRWTDIKTVTSLAPLAGLRHLESLNARRSKISDLSPLKRVPIVQLDLEETSVVDLSPLAKHPTLECLDLGNTAVHDIRPLMTCPRLCYVNLWDTKVSVANAEALVAAMKKSKARPKRDQRYLIDGYDRGVTHNTVMWTT